MKLMFMKIYKSPSQTSFVRHTFEVIYWMWYSDWNEKWIEKKGFICAACTFELILSKTTAALKDDYLYITAQSDRITEKNKLYSLFECFAHLIICVTLKQAFQVRIIRNIHINIILGCCGHYTQVKLLMLRFHQDSSRWFFMSEMTNIIILTRVQVTWLYELHS